MYILEKKYNMIIIFSKILWYLAVVVDTISLVSNKSYILPMTRAP